MRPLLYANQLLVAAHIENQDPMGPMTFFQGEQQPTAPGALLGWLAEKVADSTPDESNSFMAKVIAALRQDIETYLKMDGKTCTSTGTILKDRIRIPDFQYFLKTGLVAQCSKPSVTIRQIANLPPAPPGEQGPPKMNFPRACNSLVAIYDHMAGKKNVPGMVGQMGTKTHVSSFAPPHMPGIPGMLPPQPPMHGQVPMGQQIPQMPMQDPSVDPYFTIRQGLPMFGGRSMFAHHALIPQQQMPIFATPIVRHGPVPMFVAPMFRAL